MSKVVAKQNLVAKSLIEEYEQVVIKSLFTTFALDWMLITDRRGGDVDTLHTVRDPSVTDYVDVRNQQDYEQRGEYNSHEYHHHESYITKNRSNSEKLKMGELFDTYTGDKITEKGSYDLDHTISAKEIHDDAARVLAGMNGPDLANVDTNLNATSYGVNRSKQAKSVMEYAQEITENRRSIEEKIPQLYFEIEALEQQSLLTDKDREVLKKKRNELKRKEGQLKAIDQGEMRKKDKIARIEYERELQRYYRSKKFLTDVGITCAKNASKMGLRQSLGLVLTEIWFVVKAEAPVLIKQYKRDDDFGKLLENIANLLKRAYETVVENYKKIIVGFKDGALASVLSTVMTTIINIFATTAKNVVKIIRETWASLVEAFRILYFNPEKLPFGSLILTVTKIISSGVAVVTGVLVKEYLEKHGIFAIPLIGENLATFIQIMVTGVLGASFVYFLDNSTLIKKVVEFANNIKSVEQHKVDYFQAINVSLDAYCAELMSLDIKHFEQEVKKVRNINERLNLTTDDTEFNVVLAQIIQELEIKLPYKDMHGLNEFMLDKSKVLRF